MAVGYKIVDPAGFGDQINALKGVNTVVDAVSKFETAYSRAIKTEYHARNGKIDLAYGEWRMANGAKFFLTIFQLTGDEIGYY